MSKLERHGLEDTLTLVELLSTISFFGELKMTNCGFARDGQCDFFILRSEAKKKVPIAAECRIKGCNSDPGHCHLELSKITCALCPVEAGSSEDSATRPAKSSVQANR